MLVAAIGDLQIRTESARRENAVYICRSLLVRRIEQTAAMACQRFIRRIGHLAEAARADYRIHFRNLPDNVILKTLCKTARHNQSLAGTGVFQLRHLENRLDALFLRILDKTAGIDDNHFSLRLIVHQGIASLLQYTQHVLGIDKILVAAQ